MQFTVVFYKECNSFGDKWMERKEIRTGKSTLAEAFEIALSNGHNSQKNIEFRSTPDFESDDIFLTNGNFFGQNGRHTPGKWCWGICVWCGAVPCSPDFDTDSEAIA